MDLLDISSIFHKKILSECCFFLAFRIRGNRLKEREGSKEGEIEKKRRER